MPRQRRIRCRQILRGWWAAVLVALACGLAPAAAQEGEVRPSPQFATDETIVSVIIPRLNVRAGPSTEGTDVITVIEYGEEYPILASAGDRSWWLIQTGRGAGWVRADLVVAANVENVPDIADLQSVRAQARTQEIIQELRSSIGVRVNLNIRSEPDIDTRLIGRIPYDQRARLLGRNPAGTWYLVDYGGTTGWVSARYVIPPSGVAPHEIPVRR